MHSDRVRQPPRPHRPRFLSREATFEASIPARLYEEQYLDLRSRRKAWPTEVTQDRSFRYTPQRLWFRRPRLAGCWPTGSAVAAP